MTRREFVGTSSSTTTLRNLALTVAPKAATLFIHGESGTGKEVLARFIYANSGRAKRPFVAVNCAALPESLVESELFGHEKGAFTGAAFSKAGCFEEANTGTLFLDEITEVGPHIQAKLLRVLQEREIRRVGGSGAKRVDVRVIAASSRDLQACLRDGTLRPDLYYRLAVVELRVAPLRERKQDIAPLSEAFLQKHAEPNASALREVSDQVLQIFERYSWPGNVRELENVITRATILAGADDGGTLLPKHLPARLRSPEERAAVERLPFLISAETEELDREFRTAITILKRHYAEEAVQRAEGNKAEAARLLGISRRCLYNFLEPSIATAI